jgi:hypothetical protein
MVSGLLLGNFLSVCTCWFHNRVTLCSWLVSTGCSTCWYQCLLSNCTSISLHMLTCYPTFPGLKPDEISAHIWLLVEDIREAC